MTTSYLQRTRARVLRLFGRSTPRAFYKEPANYWDQRHRRYGTGLGGVGTLHLGEELNEREYALKWDHVAVVLTPLARSGATLLDAGCGNGYFTERAMRLGFEVTAVDFSADAVEIARAQPGREAVAWHVSPLGDFRSDTLYDVVMSIDVLFHIVDDAEWERSVANLAGLVAGDGALVVQEHLDPGGQAAPPDGTVHVRWRDELDYRRVLDGWRLVSRDHYDLPDSNSWKDLLVFVRSERTD